MSESRTQALSLRRVVAVAAVLAIPLAGTATAAPRPVPAKVSVTPLTVAIGATNTLVFKYQATTSLTAVDVTLVVPAGWTAPASGPSTASGYVSAQKGNCTIPAPAISVTGSGPWTVTVHGVTCGSSKTFSITYAKAGSSGPAGAATFASTVGGIAIAPAVVNVVNGPAAKLAFIQQPAGATGGTAFFTQPKVAIEDAAGNVVTGNTSKVTLAITTGTGTAGATFTCTADPLAAVAGVATFAGCKVNKVGTAYKLHATDGSLAAADSTPFDVAPGPAVKMVFTTQPGGTGAAVGSPLPSQPVVTLQDAGGNTATADASSVTLGITPGTGTAGAALGCTTNPLAVTSGVAAFTGCTIGLAGTGYRLRATDGALPAVDSTAFTVVNGPPVKLEFVQQPAGAYGGTAFTTQPMVAIRDAAGTTVSGDTSSVTLAIKPLTGTAGAAFSCTADPKPAVAGVATFSGCKIDKLGTAYQLHATDGALTPADSDPFDVGTGAVAGLTFLHQPGGATGGTDFLDQPVVGLVDAGGNPVSADDVTVTLAITTGTGTSGAAFGCASTDEPTAAGVAQFFHCKINKAGTDYRLHATAGGLTAADSDPFDVTVGPPAGLAFTGQPGGGDADHAWVGQPEVSVVDAGGNLVATDTSDVTLAITAGTGDATAALSCTTNPVTAVAGVASFAGCTIDKAAAGYTLHATDGTLAPTDSEAFDVTAGAAASLAFTGQPGGGDADSAWAAQPEVTLYDAHGNVATGDDSTQVTLAITSGTGDADATLSCDHSPVTADAGVAAFSGCTIDKAWTYQLTASSGALPTVDSDPFDVTPGAATHLAFTGQPGGTPDFCAFDPYGFPCLGQILGFFPPPGYYSGDAFFFPPSVAVEDAHGNVVTTDTSEVTLSITEGTGTDGATLTCLTGINPMAADSGVATFGTPGFFGPPTGCSVDLAGTGYTLHATDGTLDPADSASFDVQPGYPSSITLTLSPTTITAGVAAVTPTATITVTDAAGNRVPFLTGTLSLTSTGDATFGTITENLDHTYSATFDADVAGNQDVTAHALFFGPFGPSGIDSLAVTLTVLPGPARDVVFLTGPFSPFTNIASDLLTVQVQDEYGNPVTAPAGGTTLYLSTDSDHGSFRNADDTATITSITLAEGEYDGSFRYLDPDAGSPTITVTNPFGGDDATQVETVTLGP